MVKFFNKLFSILDENVLLLITIICTLHYIENKSVYAFSPEKAEFSIKFKNEISPYRVMGVFVLPGEIITLEAVNSDKSCRYTVQLPAGKLTEVKNNKWYWYAPNKAGLYKGTITKIPERYFITLNIFVMIPYNNLEGEYLNGYRIGKYPHIPLMQLPIYKPPEGFIEVTKKNKNALVSPHFKLKQFICKQNDGYPNYIVLKERLLLKLEHILQKVNEKGYYCDTFHIMSGYRTPYYNKIIGNVKYSRHLWGGAADIFIDENPKDKMMDDLNKDGKINWKDAAILYSIIDDMYGEKSYKSYVGGLARYKKSYSHGPFVHIDVRGKRTRWGD